MLFSQYSPTRMTIGIWAAVGMAFSLAACNTIATYRVPMAVHDQYSSGCSTKGGSYALPLGTLKATFEEYESGEHHAVFKSITASYAPDSNNIFCLDYLNSAFATDEIEISTSSKTEPKLIGLLNYINSTSVDMTGVILRKAIQTINIGLSGNVNFSSGRQARVTKGPPIVIPAIEFDPFDPNEVALLNVKAKKLGFCVVFDHFTVSSLSNESVNHYCDNVGLSNKPKVTKRLKIAQFQNWQKEPSGKGVLYRPMLDYPISIYVKDDPTSEEKWKLGKKITVALPNISPIFEVKFPRALFAKAETFVEFNNGVLSTYCLRKGSEIKGVIDVPLDIVYGIIALPGETIKAQVGMTTIKNDLLSAEKSLIEAQNEYIKFLLDPQVQNSSVNGTKSVTSVATNNKTVLDAVSGGYNASGASSTAEADQADTSMKTGPAISGDAICKKIAQKDEG